VPGQGVGQRFSLPMGEMFVVPVVSDLSRFARFVWFGRWGGGGGVFRPYGALGAYGGDSDIMGVVAFGVRCVRFVRCVWFVLVCPFTK